MRRLLSLSLLLIVVSVTLGGRPARAVQESTAEPQQNQLNVTEVLPANGSGDVQVDSVITVIFNRPVVPLSTSLDMDKLPQPLVIEPAVDGKGEWLNTSIYVFHPATDFTPGTEYTLRIPAGLQAVDGAVLNAPYQWTFHTTPPQMTRIQLGGKEELLPYLTTEGRTLLDPSVWVYFNQPVDQEEVEAAFYFRDTNDASHGIVGTFRWPEESRGTAFVFTPDNLLTLNTTYETGLDTSKIRKNPLKVPEGSSTSITFTTVTLPSILSTTPEDGANDVRGGGFQIQFSSPMDEDSIRGKIKVEPKPESIAEYDRFDSYMVSFPIEPSITYTVTLPDGMKDIYGNMIAKGRVITFTTASADPSVRLNTTGIIGFFNANNADTGLYLTSRNVDSVNLSLYTLPDDEFIQMLLQDKLYNFSPDAAHRLRSWVARLNGAPNRFTPEYLSLGASDHCPDGSATRMATGMTVQVNPAHSPVTALDAPGTGDERAFLYSGIDLRIIGGPICVEGVRWWEIALGSGSSGWASEGEDDVFVPVLSGTTVPIKNADEGALAPSIYYLRMRYGTDPAHPSSDQHYMMVMNANLTIKASVDNVLVWATDIETGKPIPDAPITIYSRSQGVVATGRTDSDGVLSVKTPRVVDITGDWHLALLRSPTYFGIGATRWADDIDPGTFGYSSNFAPLRYSVYTYTDRPIYRTDQTVYFRAVVRAADDAAYFPPNLDSVPVQITDSQGQIVYSRELQVSAFGTISGEFKLAEDAPLGHYYIQVDIPTAKDHPLEGGSTSFSVAEYRLPEFQVTTTATPDQVVQSDDVKVLTDSQYFFGAPVSAATVQYQVMAQPYLFQYTGEGHYQFYDPSDLRDDRGVSRNLTQQEGGTTNSQGQYTIQFPGQLIETDRSQVYTVEATVIDKTDQTVSSRTQVIVHAGLIYVGGQPEKYVGRAEEPMGINLIAVDWDSKGVEKQPINVEVIEERWNNVQEMDSAGRTTWTWQMEEIPVTKGQVITHEGGKTLFNFTPPNGGSFKVKLSTRDADGNEIHSAVYVWIASGAYVSWKQPNNNRINLIADQDDYKVGDTAEVLITSPFQGDQEALVTVERGSVLAHERITMHSNTYIYRLPIESQDIPNVFVSVMLVKGIDKTNPVAAFRMGLVQLTVDSEQRALNVTITSDKEESAPGEQVTFTVHTTNYRDEPVAAEVGVALTDKASLSVVQTTATSLLSTFYSLQGLGVRTGTALTMNTDGVTQMIMDMVKGGGGGGGDGVDDLRDNFVDTPYWNAQVRTNAQGEATFTVTLPDNLTTWHLDARAVTLGEDGVMLVGQNTHDIVSTHPLIVRSVTPRYFVVDDAVTLGAVVNNNTDNSLVVELNLEATGLTLENNATQIAIVQARSARRVDWRATAEDVEGASLTFSVHDVQDQYSDSARPVVGRGSDQVIPIYRYFVPETVGTSGVLREAETRTEAIAIPEGIDPSRGELTVQLQTSLAAVTLDGLTYLRNFPHQCIEQTVSRFFPNIMTYRTLTELGVSNPEMEAGLNAETTFAVQQLYRWQKVDGGWGWFPNDASNPLTTAYALIGLAEARKQGFAIQEDVIDRAEQFLRDNFITPDINSATWELNRQAFVLYALARSGDPDVARTSILFEYRERLNLDARSFLLMTFHLMRPDDSRIDTLRSDLINQAVMSATGTHFEERYADYWNWSTNTRTTALVLSALIQTGPESDLLPNIVRWLIVQRKTTAWETTQDTAWAVMALTDWMEATGELHPNFTYNVSVNDQMLVGAQASPQTAEATITLVKPMSDLVPGALNPLTIERGAGDGNLYYTAHLRTFLPVPEIEPLNQGIVVERQYLRSTDDETDNALSSISEAKLGDVIEVHLTVIAPSDLQYVVVEDPLPAGVEAIDPNLSISQQIGTRPSLDRRNPLGRGWGWWWFNKIEFRDEKVVLYSSYLPAGTYEYVYFVRAGIVGTFNVIPATAQEFYFPEVYGRSAGSTFTIDAKAS